MPDVNDSLIRDRADRRTESHSNSAIRRDTGSDHDLDFVGIQRSAEFTRLRRTHRRFVFPLCLFFFCWYMVYVLLAAYAHEFMSRQVFGQVNVGLLLGIAQFVSTGLITLLYLRFARRRLDPQVDEITDRFSGFGSPADESLAGFAAPGTRDRGSRPTPVARVSR